MSEVPLYCSRHPLPSENEKLQPIQEFWPQSQGRNLALTAIRATFDRQRGPESERYPNFPGANLCEVCGPLLNIMCAGVPDIQENAQSQDPAVGLCLGSYGGRRGVGIFLWARYFSTNCWYTDMLSTNASSTFPRAGPPYTPKLQNS